MKAFYILIFICSSVFSQNDSSITLDALGKHVFGQLRSQGISQKEVEKNFNQQDRLTYYSFTSEVSDGEVISIASPFVAYKVTIGVDGTCNLYPAEQFPFIIWDDFEIRMSRIFQNTKVSDLPEGFEMTVNMQVDLRALHPCFKEVEDWTVSFDDNPNGIPRWFSTPFNDTIRISPFRSQDTLIGEKKYSMHYDWFGNLAAIGNFSGRVKKKLWIERTDTGFRKGFYRRNKIFRKKTECSFFGNMPGLKVPPAPIIKKKIKIKGSWTPLA